MASEPPPCLRVLNCDTSKLHITTLHPHIRYRFVDLIPPEDYDPSTGANILIAIIADGKPALIVPNEQRITERMKEISILVDKCHDKSSSCMVVYRVFQTPTIATMLQEYPLLHFTHTIMSRRVRPTTVNDTLFDSVIKKLTSRLVACERKLESLAALETRIGQLERKLASIYQPPVPSFVTSSSPVFFLASPQSPLGAESGASMDLN